MKTILAAAAVFVFASTAFAAPPTPLTSVTHDATLTGAGTTASPLSVVSPYTGVVHNSSLTGAGTAASPLSVVSPYTGVVHDSSLTGAGTTASPLKVTGAAAFTVVDSTGATVGALVGRNTVALAIVGGKAYATVYSTGFGNLVDPNTIQFYHTTPDCSDTTTRYLDAFELPATAFVVTTGFAYVPILNQGILTFRSYETNVNPDQPDTPGTCHPISDYTTLATGYIYVPVSQLGTPPFSIRQ